MYKKKKILAVVPARGGSKGVSRKNLRKIHGKSLIRRVAETCSQLTWLDGVVLSTDDEEINVEGRKYGLDAPFTRPASLSDDSSSGLDVWRHALIESEGSYRDMFDISILLEPTSPCRTVDQVTAALDSLLENEYEAVVTVSPTDPKYHPLKQLTLSDCCLSHYQESGKHIVNRQELDTVFYKNGIAYVSTRQYLLSTSNIIGTETGPLIIKQQVVNIDSESDLELADRLLV